MTSTVLLVAHMIYQARSDSGCVMHVRDPAASSTTLAGVVPDSAREEPYGTVAVARIARETFRRDRSVILLSNHGDAAAWGALQAVANTIVELHFPLLSRSPTDPRQGKEGRRNCLGWRRFHETHNDRSQHP